MVIPLGITFFILKFLFNFADGILGSYLDSLFSACHPPGISHPGARHADRDRRHLPLRSTGDQRDGDEDHQVVGRHCSPISRWSSRSTTSSKQLTQVFKEGKTSYRKAVFVEWPRAGVRAVGFVTGEVMRDGEKLVVVYVPTMPNPTSGFALFFREDEVHESGMSVEDAVKFVVSGGAVVY